MFFNLKPQTKQTNLQGVCYRLLGKEVAVFIFSKSVPGQIMLGDLMNCDLLNLESKLMYRRSEAEGLSVHHCRLDRTSEEPIREMRRRL